MAELKTKATTASVSGFLATIPDPRRRKDAKAVAAIMRGVTRAKPVMWGGRIVGFGDFSYRRSNGETFKWFLTGFAPRGATMIVYLIGGSDKALLKKLGKYKLSGSCLHIRRLEEVDQPTLRKLIATSVKNVSKRFARKE